MTNEKKIDGLDGWVVLFEQSTNPITGDELPLAFHCHAIDDTHAREQCMDAYPDANLLWTYMGSEAEVEAAIQDYYYQVVMNEPTKKYKIDRAISLAPGGENEGENQRPLYQIIALRDIARHGVKKGDRGGWVESGHNLSQEGNAWIAKDAMVFDHAQVIDNALVTDLARAYDSSLVRDNAVISGEAQVSYEAAILGNAKVSGCATVLGTATVSADAVVTGYAIIDGKASIKDNAIVDGEDYTHDGEALYVGENAQVSGFATLTENPTITGNVVNYPALKDGACKSPG